MVKLAQKFVPVLVDGDVDKEFGTKYNAEGYPHTIFTDPKGKEISRTVGAVPVAEFLGDMKSALKKIGPVPPKKAAKDLEDAAADLAKAREKKDWRATVKSLKAIEKIDHEGPALDAARAARKEAEDEAKKRLTDAAALVAAGKDAEARAALSKIVSEFDGLDQGAEAKDMLKLLDAKPPAGGGSGGEKGNEPSSGPGEKGKR